MLETQGGVSEQNKKSSNSSSNSQNENLVTANNRRNRQNVEQVQEQEMGLKQFSTITDLLIKLKGNLSKYLSCSSFHHLSRYCGDHKSCYESKLLLLVKARNTVDVLWGQQSSLSKLFLLQNFMNNDGMILILIFWFPRIQ